LVVDAHLEPGRALVDEHDGAFRLDGGDGGVYVLGHHVVAVQHAACHVLTVPRVALDHLVGPIEARVPYLGHGQLLVVRLLRGYDWRVRGQWEVYVRVRHQVGQELGQVDVQRAVMDDTICAISRFRFVYFGSSMSKLRQHMS